MRCTFAVAAEVVISGLMFLLGCVDSPRMFSVALVSSRGSQCPATRYQQRLEKARDTACDGWQSLWKQQLRATYTARERAYVCSLTRHDNHTGVHGKGKHVGREADVVAVLIEWKRAESVKSSFAKHVLASALRESPHLHRAGPHPHLGPCPHPARTHPNTL